MHKNWILAVACLAMSVLLTAALQHEGTAGTSKSASEGIVTGKSAYGMEETIIRIKADVEKKGIMFFSQIDQTKLAGAAGITLHPSTLLVFGNPALGSQFVTANPVAGLDWPVRLLVFQDAGGQVWTAYTDFNVIARRHRISNREAVFNKASQVIASITSAAAAK